MNQERPVLVCLCHLRWSGVWQRPQHILSRLSKDFDIIFHEEPYLRDEPDLETHYLRFDPEPNIVLLQPQMQGVITTEVYAGYQPGNWQLISTMLRDFLESNGYSNRTIIAWVYTPMAFPVAQALEPQVVVYDCMDELALFRFAPPEIKEQEKALLQRADVVFCGGASMYRNRKDLHPNVHMLLSGVDGAHFERAKDPQTTIPEDIANLPHPRIGYWGVLDERLDWPLLEEVAHARPEWQLVLLGPFSKVEPDDLPKAPNLHYMGKREYADLPRYAKGFDIAMMPFAMNEATRYISPTKTLEYMAAGKPIVSTPVADVVDPYKGPVLIASNSNEFIYATEQLLNEPEQKRAERMASFQQWVEHWSWDNIVNMMRNEIMRALKL